MNVSLTVAVPGDMEGKKIPITLTEFLIGRDPQCHLCPGSPRVAPRHCAIILRANKVYLKTFDHVTGTYVNDRRINGEVQLLDGDFLKIGPLLFRLNLETVAAEPEHHEDLVAGLLLLENQNGTPPAPPPQPETVPEQTPPPPKRESAAAKAIREKYRRFR